MDSEPDASRVTQSTEGGVSQAEEPEQIDPTNDAGEEECGSEWTLQGHYRLLLQHLLNAISDQVDAGEIVPSVQLQISMDNARHELTGWS